MGKRELLLIIGFLIVGAVVYQATAPPPSPGETGFSFGRLIEAARREISGNRAHAEAATTAAHPLDPEVTEVRITGTVHELVVTGETRDDVEAALRVSSSAYNDAEAKQYADGTTLQTDRAGTSLAFRVKYVEGRHTGRQRTVLALKVPSRLRVRVEPGTQKLTISHVAALETMGSRGGAAVTDVAGRVTMEHRGGPVVIEQVQSLRFVGRGAELKVTGVQTDTSIRMDPGGEIAASGMRGAVDVEARNAEVTLQGLESAAGPIRVNINGGSAKLQGIKADTRVDARNGEVDIVAAAAAPITVYNDGEDVAITLPPGGYRFDAVVNGGRIAAADGAELEKLGLTVSSAEAGEDEARATGTVRGGGPSITVRSTRGDLTLRSAAN